MSDNSILANVIDRGDLVGAARQRARPYDRKTVNSTDLDGYLADGWTVSARGQRSVTVVHPKRHDIVLEDRVWMLLWRMLFPRLSGSGGAFVTINPGGERKVTSQVDVLALDDELCVAIECKSAISRGRRPSFQEDLAKHAAVREPLQRGVSARGNNGSKRSVVLVLWTQNAVLSRNDKERAREQNVVLLNEADLEYYETLVHHLGPAARYQFLAELIPGKAIPGLEIRVPALQSKMGAHTCYTFSVAPEYLLKIAYVSHRTPRDSDVATYQRMLARSRLKSIASYICSGPDAMFPTNIVINLEKPEKGRRGSGAQFEKAKQEEGAEGATLGWLTLRPAYKSAWVIDGQHRLYAYSYAGPEAAAKGRLSVLAFVGLPGSIQQKLFVEINAEQKSVKRSLLQELFADLHRGADDPKELIKALVSEAIQELDDDPDSPFFDRILLATSVKTDARCITLNSLFSALNKPGFYFSSVRDNLVIDPGPFWDKTDDAIIRRTTSTLNCWFGAIRLAVPVWWDAGASEGGGLAMNDGVSIAVDVLRSVIDHLGKGRVRLADLTVKEVGDCLTPWAKAMGDYFARMTEEEKLQFRGLRGNQGHTTGLRHAQGFIQQRFPEFQPDGLAEFLEREKARTNDTANSLINEIERLLSRVVVGVLRANLGVEDEQWWYRGVPRTVRAAASTKQEDDKNSRGAKERYLDFIDYRDIVHENWLLFSELLAPGKRNESKGTRTTWMARINEIRKIAAHGSSETWVSFEQLTELNDRLAWLRGVGTGAGAIAPDGESDSLYSGSD
jgi:DNA sulfur modification protein DndB